MDALWFSISWRGDRGCGDEIRWSTPVRLTRPFFLGLIMGQFVIAGICPIVDYSIGMIDNVVFWI